LKLQVTCNPVVWLLMCVGAKSHSVRKYCTLCFNSKSILKHVFLYNFTIIFFFSYTLRVRKGWLYYALLMWKIKQTMQKMISKENRFVHSSAVWF
jgi:hypothetical protein